MNTQRTTQPTVDNHHLSNAENGGLRIHDALRAAIMRKIFRLGDMREELDRAGWTHLVTASELYLLESEGFIVDFDSGLCVDTFAEVTS